VASHISYIADVAQWDFNCSKTSAEAGPETAASSWSSGGAKSAACSFTSTAATSGSRPSSSRGDQLVEQPHHQQQEQQLQGQQGAAAGGHALGSSNSLDVPGQQQQQSVVGLGGLMAQQQQQQVLAPQLSGDVGPGAKDVDGSVADAAQAGPGAAVTSDKVPSPVRSPSPKAPTAAAQPRVLTCYAGGKTITTFPVSVPDTPDHSPMHSRPSTPELQAALAAGAGDAGRHLRPTASSYPGAAAAGNSSSSPVVVQRHGRFTFVEGSSRYQGPELAADDAAAAGPTAAAAGAASKPGQLLKQRCVSSPDMALLMRLQAPRSSTSSSVSAGGSALSDQPLSPLSPASALSPAVSPKVGLAATAEAAAATRVSSPGEAAPAAAATLSTSSTRAVEQQQAPDGTPSLAVASSPRGSSGGLGLEASAKATAGGAASPRQPISPPQQHLEQHEHHHNLQHKIAVFFAHHGLGKGSKGASPFVSRDVSPNVSQDMGHAATISSTRVSAAGAGSSSSNAAMSSLSRPANPLHEIYGESYSSREGSKAGVAHSPRSISPRAGSKEHATAAQIWQHVKEACAEAASDVGHIFKSRSGGSLAHTDRTTSRSPERPKQQQCSQSTSPQPSDRAAGATAGPAGEQLQHDSGHHGCQPQPLSSPGDSGAAVGPIKEGPAGPGASRSGSSSNLVRLGSRGSGSMPPIVSLGAGSSSTSKPPRYQQTPTRRVSDEQHMKQPLSPQRQDLQAAPEQQQQELTKHQAVLQQELQAMQQQQGPDAPEVQEAASAVSTLAAAAAAVKQAAAAAAGGDGVGPAAADGVSSSVHDQQGSHDTEFATQQHPGVHESVTAGTRDESAAGAGLSELGSRELSFAAPSIAASSSAGRAGGSSGGSKSDGLASHALDSPGQEQGVAQESSVTFPALTGRSSSGSCQPQQQQRSLSPSWPGPQMQQQQQQQQHRPESPFAVQPQTAGVSGGGAQSSQRAAGAAASGAAAASGVASTGSHAGPTLMQLRAAESLGPAGRVSARDTEPQRGRTRLSAAEAAAQPELEQQQQQQGLSGLQPSSQHPSASPSKHVKGRFTIIKT